ncbi:MAG: methylmalonyl-CoA mutase family protein [Deltaproteobacteria bacterium]|nr:methylmalonyl-CoA mutase family protein [Deltaproteobacteria bacterium]MBI2227797.1 methylmalonyl-CoA mutase family protein [Deltaproteobacteria bacterium]
MAMTSTPKGPRNLSGIEIRPVYGPEDVKGLDDRRDLGVPGEFPFTRGIYPTMYRGRLWTMRQFAGFGTAEESNRRYHYLLKQGNTGLSVAFDMPTLMGYDSDDARSRGEVGRCGVAIDSLADMEILFRSIPLGRVSVSMTINGPAIVLFAMYLAVAERQGVKFRDLQGTLQNDILKEYIAQKEWICPPAPSLKIVNDIIRFCVESAPRYHPVSVSGYHIREAGSTAVQELAFTLYDGLTYVKSAIDCGLKVDDFAPRLSFFFNAHNDFFEEIAKYRAARRLWAREMKSRFQPANPVSLALRFHTQTAGCALTAQQPYNNVVRVSLQGLAAVLGGTQSLHTNSLDETLALPTEEAVTIALRTQQIIAHESGVANTIDPLGGAYYVEWLTERMEAEAKAYFAKLDEMGGMVSAIERGFPQGEIHRAAVAYQKEVDARERLIVGVNAYAEPQEHRVPTLRIKGEVEKKQVQKLRQREKSRNVKKLASALGQLAGVAEANGDLMPAVIAAVKAEATVGEICEVFRRVYGRYRETVSL